MKALTAIRILPVHQGLINLNPNSELLRGQGLLHDAISEKFEAKTFNFKLQNSSRRRHTHNAQEDNCGMRFLGGAGSQERVIHATMLHSTVIALAAGVK